MWIYEKIVFVQYIVEMLEYISFMSYNLILQFLNVAAVYELGQFCL